MKRIRFFLLFVSITLGVFAHDSKPAYLQIEALDSTHYDVLWKVPLQSKAKPYGLQVRFDSEVKDVHKPVAVEVAGWHIENWKIQSRKSLVGTHVGIEGLSSTAKEVLLKYIDLDGHTFSTLISPSRPQYVFQVTPHSGGVVAAYTKMGFEHILEGTDHLLFVACLVIIASTFAKLMWTITGFTLAHSVTLFLSALGIVQLPIPPIEAIIALSIVFLAMEIAKGNKKSLTYRYPVVVSSSFGLLHGFGFASALMEIGLPKEERISALLFFNVGVELGQIAFVLFLLTSAWIIKKVWKRSRFFSWDKLVSYIIGSVAMMWLMQRILAF